MFTSLAGPGFLCWSYNPAITGCLSGQTASKEVNEAIWVTKVEMTPVLTFHQATSFSGCEGHLFNKSSVNPDAYGVLLLTISVQIYMSKFTSFLYSLTPGLNVRYYLPST